MRRQKVTRPLSGVRRNVERERRKRPDAAAAQGIDVDEIEMVEATFIMHVCEISHPGIVNGHISVFRGGDAAYVLRADV